MVPESIFGIATNAYVFTIPVTSPIPIVVAFAPMVRVFIAEPSHNLNYLVAMIGVCG